VRNFAHPFVAELRRVLQMDFPAEMPVYILSDIDVRSQMGPMFCHGPLGWTGSELDLALQSILQDAGMWEGRGFATIIKESVFLDQQPLHRHWLLMNVTFHEAGHFLTYPEPVDHAAEEEVDSSPTSSEDCSCKAPSPTLSRSQWAMIDHVLWASSRSRNPELSKKQRCHGPEFLRVQAHIHHRMAAAGVVAIEETLTCHVEPWTGFREYWTALGDEPSRLAHLSIREILNIDPPPAFAALSEADERRLSQLDQEAA